MSAPLIANIPDRLKQDPRWVTWRYEEVTNGKGETRLTKEPYRADGAFDQRRIHASSTDPKTWRSFSHALAAFEAGGWNGIGYMFEGSGLVGVDLDHVCDSDSGLIEHYAQTVIDRLATYWEISPSRTGIHLIMEGALPKDGRKFGNVEMYNTGRFFTITGNTKGRSPLPVAARQDELTSLHAELTTDYPVLKLIQKDTKLKALFEGDQRGYESQSQADLALCGGIAWMAGRNKQTIDRIFRRSKLYRTKWDERHGTQTYGEMTIAKACTSDRQHVSLTPNANGGYTVNVNGTPVQPDTNASLDADAFLASAPTSDAGNAECLEVLYGDHLRYCHDRKKWLAWDGNRWGIDGDGAAERLALAVVRARRTSAAQIEDTEKARKAFIWALGSESEGKRSAMLNTARILRTFATRVDLYDRDPFLAGVPNGVLDLEYGKHRTSRREDYITAQLGADFDPAAMCPLWEKFLREIFAGDVDLIAYVQRAIGYTLTGDTREHKLFLCFGHGANGKSVFLDVLSRLLGEYAANTSFDTFDAGRRNEATNDLAALKGKRLVTVIETEDDRRLAEARVKQVTGQDKVTCRFLYGEYFDYRPQFKIWMAMNHKPVINGTDNGIWRRIQLIPFTQSFLEREDKTLATKLRAELPGILNWALAGLTAWQRDGLGTAAAIEEATREYRRESDLVSQWLEESTERDTDGRMATSAAIDSYAAWCKRNGYRAPTARSLGRRLVELGIEIGRTGSHRFYFGLTLLDADSDVSDVSMPFSGNSSSKFSHDPFPPKQQNNVTNVTKPKPPREMNVSITLWLNDAEAGDTDALQQVHTRIAANPGYDWAEQLCRVRKIAGMGALL